MILKTAIDEVLDLDNNPTTKEGELTQWEVEQMDSNYEPNEVIVEKKGHSDNNNNWDFLSETNLF